MALYNDFMKGFEDEENVGIGFSLDTNFIVWTFEESDYFEVIAKYDLYMLRLFKNAYELHKASKSLLGEDDDE